MTPPPPRQVRVPGYRSYSPGWAELDLPHQFSLAAFTPEVCGTRALKTPPVHGDPGLIHLEVGELVLVLQQREGLIVLVGQNF